MVHRWDSLTFLHWRYPVEVVQRLLPAGLEVEPMDGSAWIGLVPFVLRVRVPGVPYIPWMTQFPETNVRTYVRASDGTTGIWFFSLDAARLGAVLVARSSYRLPYFWGCMRVDIDGSRVTYTSRRRWPDPARGARSTVAIEVGEPFRSDDLGDLDHYLTARWMLYSAHRRGLHQAAAWHEPWPLHRARAVSVTDELIAASGAPPPTGEPLVHWSPRVEVRIGWPHRLVVAPLAGSG
jgi:uncharacterized protein